MHDEVAVRIAQATCQQALSRDEVNVPAVSPNEITEFFNALEAVHDQNSAVNIQTCSNWISKNIIPSEGRIKTMGKLLVALSKAIEVLRNEAQKRVIIDAGVRKRLSLLCIVHEVMRPGTPDTPNTAQQSLICFKPYMEDLAELVASVAIAKDTWFVRVLHCFLGQWHRQNLYTAGELKYLIRRLGNASKRARDEIPPEPVLPKFLGDKPARFYDLPASTMLRPLIKRPNRPLSSYDIRSTEFSGKQPSDRILQLLDDFFDEIDLRTKPIQAEKDPDTESDATSRVGENVQYYKAWRNKQCSFSGLDLRFVEQEATGRNALGWSDQFCEQWKENRLANIIHAERERLEAEYVDKKTSDVYRNQGRSSRSRSPSPQRRAPKRDNRPSSRGYEGPGGRGRQPRFGNIQGGHFQGPPVWDGSNAASHINRPVNANFPVGVPYGQPPLPPPPPPLPSSFMSAQGFPPAPPPPNQGASGQFPAGQFQQSFTPHPPNFSGPIPGNFNQAPSGYQNPAFNSYNNYNNPQGFGNFNHNGHQNTGYNGRGNGNSSHGGGYRGNNQRGRGNGGDSRWN
ncbi:hypothetical protein B0J11DRAFT_517983 [Dendryphion nanum]|uniref:CID domain-containing protein n=1 Tax=Dendryphion nanum TaxID=256645 RepID=A0A9P9ECS7_9PLEO|nr:hypothetical protein B0J11DRAFT_517983 [Dendryphion nanum]